MKQEINLFIAQAKYFYLTIKFAEKENTFLGHNSIQGERFEKECIYDIKTYPKQTETGHPIHAFIFCHPPGAKKGFIK